MLRIEPDPNCESSGTNTVGACLGLRNEPPFGSNVPIRDSLHVAPDGRIDSADLTDLHQARISALSTLNR